MCPSRLFFVVVGLNRATTAAVKHFFLLAVRASLLEGGQLLGKASRIIFACMPPQRSSGGAVGMITSYLACPFVYQCRRLGAACGVGGSAYYYYGKGDIQIGR